MDKTTPAAVTPWPMCESANCVDAKRIGPDAIRFTSTIDGNDEGVTYTDGEVAQFLGDVKAGRWDHLIA